MAVIKEWRCFAHGPFEGAKPTCPHGCTTVIEREFRTAPGVRSGRTRNIDSTLAKLAQDFGYTDLSNKNGGGSPPKSRGNEYRPFWADVPKGDRMKSGGVIEHVDGASGGAQAAVNSYNVHDAGQAGQIFTDLASQLPPPRPLIDRKLVYGDAAMTLDAANKAPQ